MSLQGCGRHWTTDRIVDEPGSRAQLGPVPHICRRETGHDGPHLCACGREAP